MITIYEQKYTKNIDTVQVEMRGLSTDEKPTETTGGATIGNGSTFIEIDTGKLFFYDLENQQWLEVGGNNVTQPSEEELI